MPRYRLHGPVQADVESAALTRAILAFLDHVEANDLRKLFVSRIFIAMTRKADGSFTVSLTNKRPPGLRGYRQFCAGDPARVARIFERDATEIARLASIVHPLSTKDLETWLSPS